MRALWLVPLAACYSPTVGDCSFLCGGEQCPTGLHCVAGYCRTALNPTTACQVRLADAGADANPLDTDPNNCGTVGHTCSTLHCVKGECAHRIFVTKTAMVGGTFPPVPLQACNGFEGTFGATFLPWLSTSTQQADARHYHSNAPYVRLDDVEVAADWNGLTSGRIEAPINVTEAGSLPGINVPVWTGTGATGQSNGPNCVDWGSGGSGYFGRIGYADKTDNQWTNAQTDPPCNSTAHVYCIEQ